LKKKIATESRKKLQKKEGSRKMEAEVYMIENKIYKVKNL
jgi:hypothetical protein